jgi:hypothetical protein
MEIKIYYVSDVLLLTTEFTYELTLGKEIINPFKKGDLIIWGKFGDITQDLFEKYIDQYFEYVIMGNRTSYRITAILTKFTQPFD